MLFFSIHAAYLAHTHSKLRVSRSLPSIVNQQEQHQERRANSFFKILPQLFNEHVITSLLLIIHCRLITWLLADAVSRHAYPLYIFMYSHCIVTSPEGNRKDGKNFYAMNHAY